MRNPKFVGGGARGGAPPLKTEEYRLLRDLISERLGLWFGPESAASLERRLRERLGVRGISSFSDYYHLLKYSELANEEWDEAGEVLTTHETYFFREDYQLRAFKNELLPMLVSRPRRRVHVWSAGCATGEEAYTIAMLMLESGLCHPQRGWELRVHGSDLSKKCISVARRGIYGGSSFRATSSEARERWFRPVPETRDPSTAHAPTAPYYGVAPDVRSLCHFTQMNLLDAERTALVGRCDIIFCRNVVIYFDAAARRRVIDMFYERLVPGGVLLLGHSESLLNVTTAFELLHLKEDLVYRRPLVASSVK
jgi:chemotaxis protein methyltransferase CheR